MLQAMFWLFIIFVALFIFGFVFEGVMLFAKFMLLLFVIFVLFSIFDKSFLKD